MVIKGKKKMGGKREEKSRVIWDCGSPLYDSYEIASVGNLIERNMMILPSPCGSSKRFAVEQSKFRSEEGLKVEMEALSGRNLWKRKMIAAEERNYKAKKLRRVLYSFCNSFWSMQKKKLQI
ncbi:ATP-dependent DNA helicase mph1 [Melia azedarach]|uniref:ATP-dependent DNA helicase mph1 n=1 Tax=Melia azedarach TaxID=155640 RepID=A0ACC1XKU8_MELAZ|nr:ATP-dependent DNA helicase mph1 [Melia azedarach]